MDLGATGRFVLAMQGAGEGGFSTCNGGGVTSQRHCGGADQLQWRFRVYKRWSVHNTALEMIYIDGHCVGG